MLTNTAAEVIKAYGECAGDMCCWVPRSLMYMSSGCFCCLQKGMHCNTAYQNPKTSPHCRNACLLFLSLDL